MEENIKYLKSLKEIGLRSKRENIIGNKIGDGGCVAIFNNSRYLSNLEKLIILRKKS